MNAQWRLFLAALGWVIQGSAPAAADAMAAPHQASRFIPVVGICIGLIAAAVYWAAAQVWPASLAVVLSMLAAALMTVPRASQPAFGALYWVFLLFVKYNALMALSAASVPLPLPVYGALGLIMVAAQAASHGLVVSVMSTDPAPGLRVTAADLIIALGLGLVPATLLGIPGLIGLVAAIVMRIGLTSYGLQKFRFGSRERSEIVQQLTEVSFYLGALASWKYV